MTTNTMSFLGIASTGRISPHRIFSWSNDFQMGRVNAISSSAKMINLQKWGNWAYEHLVCNAVSAKLCAFKHKHSVALVHDSTSPQPARDILKGHGWIDKNLREKSSKKFDCGLNAIRMFQHHLSLQYRFSGLGFRGLQNREALSF